MAYENVLDAWRDDEPIRGKRSGTRKRKQGPLPPPPPPLPPSPPHSLLLAKPARRFDPSRAKPDGNSTQPKRYKRVRRRREVRDGEFAELHDYNNRRRKLTRRRLQITEGEALVAPEAFVRAYGEGVLAPEDLLPTRFDANSLPDARTTYLGGQGAPRVDPGRGVRIVANAPSWCRRRLDVTCDTDDDNKGAESWALPWRGRVDDAIPIDRAVVVCGVDKSEARARIYGTNAPERPGAGETCEDFVARVNNISV